MVIGYFWSIDNCILHWRCRWARCWMLQDMDHMEASCIFYVKVGTFHQLKQNKICVLTVTIYRRGMLNIRHDSIFRVCFMYAPGDFLRKTSPDILSIKDFSIHILQTWDFNKCPPLCNPLNKQTTSDWLNANCRMVGTFCNLHLCTAEFIFSWTFKFVVADSILLWS